MPKIKNIDEQKKSLSAQIKQKEQFKVTLQRKVSKLIKSDDSSLEDLYDQINKLTNEIYVLKNKYMKL